MLVYVPHKMRNYAFLLRSRAKQKYTNKCDARAKLLFCLLNLLFFPRSRCPPYRRIDVNCQNWPIIVYRVFPLTWPASTQIYWNRRKSLHKNIIQLPQDGLGHQHGRRFIVLGHQYGRRDVMWKHSIERFHSRGQQPCKFIGTKESVCIRKEFNSHRTGLGHQHGRRFIVLGH